MSHKLYWNILDRKRKKILPLPGSVKDTFYLAGGTALALQLGHRDSEDFDFFSPVSYDTSSLFEELKKTYFSFQVVRVQEDKDTLTVIVDNGVKLSFFTYPYPLMCDLIETDYMKIAALEDIALMKFSAIVSRSLQKDYVDLYFILKKISLSKLLELVPKKFRGLDINLVLKSLVYFDDVIDEPILYKNGFDVEFTKIKDTLTDIVKKYLLSENL